MIIRTWSARATDSGARDYHRYFEDTLLPRLRELPGFRGGYLLARRAGGEVELTTHTLWVAEDAIRAFAGDEITAAIVEPVALAHLLEMDTSAIHRTVLVDASVRAGAE
jgi:heme-degrading monooxygenase HmoA